ncbi:putative Zn-dependent peptidase [Mesonia hippocampi]|uniref:Putative Zn-dependent peptidase n=1 Tax=Mesonia hippocampi TaxID=1628250 RepID=A0A840EKY4_9FLAO|nr:M16 family metallopeptidase [Mesonia hippocampi]MBB4117761.1 putative Zn-dependent peptidase [Mesonia hippocampi]
MNKLKPLFLFLFATTFLFLGSCTQDKKPQESTKVVTEKHTDKAGFTYETVSNDPTGLRLYTLENGLKVYLSKNTDEPKIQTFVAVRAGSNYDPKEATGLAHYLEHMVFKGTSEIGTIDWGKEKEFLKQISDLYEAHKAENDPEKKKEIYRKIDEISLEASNYSVANEYDKMVQSLGATGTNAHTWFEETVYKNKIPANELNKWLKLESDRFGELTLRLFHTELEAVFEEFNRGQDNDFRKVYAAMLDGLFPQHPYGQQTTIGTAEHLKNPSMVAIHEYFDKYYVPSNMAVVLVGDLDFDTTIAEVNKTFGKLESKEVVHPELPKETPITSPIVKEVYGPTAENISITFRSGGVNTADEKFVTLCDMILTNGTAGLIDLNLNQKQLVQNAGSSPMFLNDYGFHNFSGTPKAGQSLDEVKELILAQIEKLKKGEFDQWMLEAVINDMKLSQTRQYENSSALASAYYNAFIHHEDWQDKVNFLEELRKISKKELVEFANNFYKDNYVVVYKRQGEDKNIVKVENPGITPVNLNRDKKSEYLANFTAKESPALAPQFIDYKKAIKTKNLTNGVEVSYVNNPNNDLFELNFIFDMGDKHNKDLGLAVNYSEYLGTDKYTAEELKKEFYKLGIEYKVGTGEDKTYVSISGLKENLPKGLTLLEHFWDNVTPDGEAYAKYVESIQKSRQDTKTNKGAILWSGLMNYGQYGENSPLRNIYSTEALQAKKPADLVNILKKLKNYKQRIFYYGKDVEAAITALNKEHKLPEQLQEYPEAKNYIELETGNKVYFVNYDMVQAEMLFLAKGDLFDADKMAASTLFNAYFGRGLSSIVFQEIRESKSLAYSAFSAYANASEKEKPNYIYAYIGTQANKMPQAVDAMLGLMNDMPEAEEQFNAAKEAALKKIAAQRITKSNIFWSYERLKKQGIENDNRKAIYEGIQEMELKDLHKFFNENIKGEEYTIMVIGNEKEINFKALEKLGTIEKLKVDYLFNFK